MQKLAACRVAVFGIGGVGGYVVEALARSGVGALDLIDDDESALRISIVRSLQPGKQSENIKWTLQRNEFMKSIPRARSEPTGHSIILKRRISLIFRNMTM